MSNIPAVIIKSRFITTGIAKQSKFGFNNFLNYMDRREVSSEKNDFENYQEYMSNGEKSTGLFTNEKDSLSDEEKNKYKEIFKRSQE